MINGKNHLTLNKQAQRLLTRGLGGISEEALVGYLKTMNYYRFSGYAREFQRDPRNKVDGFETGATFERIQAVVVADERLRLLFLEALAIVEIKARSAFAYESGLIYGDGAFYLEPENYLEITPKLDGHIQKMRSDLMRPKQPTVERYREGEDLSQVPVWVAIEKVSFGAFAKMCWYLNDENVSKNTAVSLGISSKNFAATLHAFSVLRNVCAHHGQLWNRSFDIAFQILPKEKKHFPKHKSPGSYTAIIILNRWLKTLTGSTGWGDRVDSLLSEHEEYASGILFPIMK